MATTDAVAKEFQTLQKFVEDDPKLWKVLANHDQLRITLEVYLANLKDSLVEMGVPV